MQVIAEIHALKVPHLFAADVNFKFCWRSGVRYAMRTASQLPGRGSTDVDDAPAPAC